MACSTDDKLSENISRPKLNWINDTHCYRVTHKDYKSAKNKDIVHDLAPYNDNEESTDLLLDCDINSELPDITVSDNGRFKTSYHVPAYYYRFIIGAKGSRRRKIEDETQCSIKIPNSNTNDLITISGPTERSVVSGMNRIDMIVNEMKFKHEITHFVSIPMTSKGIQSNFEKFKQEILMGHPIPGVEQSIFQNPKKLHLTIGTMVLLDDYEKNLAVKTLEECREKIIRPLLERLKSSLKIRMFGVEYMNDDPESVDVLYAKVEIVNKKYSDVLQTISDKIVQAFAKRGLTKKQYGNVKLHVTLINTRYRAQEDVIVDGQNQTMKPRVKRKSFVATDIVKKYQDYNFGEIPMETFHLSVRHQVNESGFYESLSAVSTLN